MTEKYRLEMRLIEQVNWRGDSPNYIISIPFAADPTRSLKITVPLSGRFTNQQAAVAAAINHVDDVSDAELQVLMRAQLRAARQPGQGSN